MNEFKVPLTVSSLQILCSVHRPVPEENRSFQMCSTTFHNMSKTLFSESNPDGTLAFGWQLRNALSQTLSNPFVLSLSIGNQQLINKVMHYQIPYNLSLYSSTVGRFSAKYNDATGFCIVQ